MKIFWNIVGLTNNTIHINSIRLYLYPSLQVDVDASTFFDDIIMDLITL